MARRLRVLGLGVALSATGCGVLSARPPSATLTRGEVPSCNPGKGAVAVDVLMTAALGIGLLVAASEEEGGVAVGLALGTAAYGGSAVYASRSATRCRRALAEVEEVRLEREAGIVAPDGATPAPGAPVAVGTPVAAAKAVPVTAGKPAPLPAPLPAPVPAPATTTEAEPVPVPDEEDRWRDFWIEGSR